MSVTPAATAGLTSALPGVSAKAGAGTSTDNIFSKLVQDADAQNRMADEQFAKFATGQSEGMHQVVLTAAKADLSFRLVLELRNKLMDSYQEIMRMQV